MARIAEPSAEDLAEYQQWLAHRPAVVRAVAERFDPWSLYRLGSSGHRVTIRSFDKHDDDTVTVTVRVSGRFNLVAFERAVFGIAPDNLVECDLPGADDVVGTILTSGPIQLR